MLDGQKKECIAASAGASEQDLGSRLTRRKD